MKNGIIYKITCLANRKCYIGQTFQPVETRWIQHLSGKGNKPLYNAIQKHGVRMFTIEVIHEGITCWNTLNLLEIALIAAYDSYKNGYNENRGGQDEYRLSEAWEHADEICRLYTEDHESLSEIARRFDVSAPVISSILEANQIKRRTKGQSHAWEHVDEICRLYTKERKNLLEIADKFGVSQMTIHKILNSHSVEIRDIGRQKSDVWQHQSEICKLYAVAMKSTEEIAEMHNTNAMMISRVLKANNIKTEYRRNPKTHGTQ